ncbi:MAG: HDOD domain-containing protein [Pseudomonadota bacterium]|jgi:putative nucleotidyltransferase with HDIG domain
MLRKLFGLDKEKIDQPKPLVNDGVREVILHSLGLKSVPVMPGAAHHAFIVATNPNSEARDFIELLEADEGLAARVLKIANSVFYDRGGSSKSIIDAVNAIGITELRNLMNATALGGLFPVRHYLRAEFWAHNIATALTAKIVAPAVGVARKDQVFICGLMHDVGKLLLLQQHMDRYERVLKRGLVDGVEAHQAEVKSYPFDHTQVGQLVAEKWNFSTELFAAIGEHHRGWGDLERDSLAAVIKLADAIVHANGLGASHDRVAHERIYAPLLDDAWAFFGVPVRDQKSLSQQATLAFNDEFPTYESWGKV